MAPHELSLLPRVPAHWSSKPYVSNFRAAKNKIDHPRAVYLREDQILPSLDHWLARKFDPHALPQTLRELAEAQDTSAGDAAAEEARRGIATCDAKLRQHRAALEAGADPKIVTGWIAEVQAQRAAAEARLRHSPSHQHVSPDDISRAVTSLGDLVAVLASADPVKKAATYAQLGLTLTYRPGERTVTAEARPLGHMYVTTWCAISFGVSSPGWWGDRLVAACYQAAARSDTSEPMARTVSGRSSRRPIQRCSGRQCLDPAMACSTQIRCEDWVRRACSQAWTTSGGASLAGFFGGTLTWAGWSRRRPRSPASASACTSGY